LRASEDAEEDLSSVVDLIASLIQLNPSKRLTPEEALKHKFLN